jgi:hypothetical protein
MLFLRQSTASQSVVIGPFVDSTDGNTAETALTVDAADIRLSKNGANIVAKNSGGGTHDELGYYTITLDATDTDTVGRLQLMVHESGALPVYHEYQVLEEATFDMMFASSALGYIANAPVNVAQVSGDTTAADNLETAYDDTAGAVPWMGIIDQGTAQSGSGTTIVLRAGASFGDDTLIGATIHIVSGTGVGQRRLITDWVSATDTATVDTWVTNPDNTSVYKVYASAPASNASTPLDAAGTRAALGLASANLDTQLSGLDGKLDTIDNFLDTEIASIVTSVGTTIPNALTTIDDFLDTEVAAIKAKTDQLTFTVANVLDVNALRINGVAVQGAGTSGNLWRG